MVIGTATMLLAKFLALPGDPVYYGLAACAIVIMTGLRDKDAK
jgi:hypothetical protein